VAVGIQGLIERAKMEKKWLKAENEVKYVYDIKWSKLPGVKRKIFAEKLFEKIESNANWKGVNCLKGKWRNMHLQSLASIFSGIRRIFVN
jgi:hypothetical protein